MFSARVRDRSSKDWHVISYLIQAHANPAQLLRLVEALRSPVARTWVHIDRKAPLTPFETAIGSLATFVDDRVDVHWGGWSQVQATLNLMRRALRDEPGLTHLALLSGADYPLSSPETLLAYLQASGQEHIDTAPFPSAELKKPWSRISKRFVEGGERGGSGKARAIRLLNRVLRLLPDRAVHRRLKGLTLHTGGSWWVISADAGRAILDFVDSGHPSLALFRSARCPDEMFFQTLLSSGLTQRPIGCALTWADWSRRSASPEVLNETHLALFADPNFRLDGIHGTGPCFFVRKMPVDDGTLAAQLRKLWRKPNMTAT